MNTVPSSLRSTRTKFQEPSSKRRFKGKGQEAGKVCGCVLVAKSVSVDGCERRKTKPRYETVSLLHLVSKYRACDIERETAKRQRVVIVSSILTLSHLPLFRIYLDFGTWSLEFKSVLLSYSAVCQYQWKNVILSYPVRRWILRYRRESDRFFSTCCHYSSVCIL